jgi:hypothetical protein
MAKGSNANSDLYKRLHEDYGLELNVDFYLHPQSGSYIIKHNAVKKIVSMQKEKGFIIETPMGEDIIWINDGTKEGVHGKEVVVAGNFYLKNRDGVVLDKVFRLGEVNAKNCKNAYPQTMALKRMYDRGVLDLLRFAQEGLYSDVEADEFKQSRPRQKAEKAVATKPQLPPKPTVKPTVMPAVPEKKTEKPEQNTSNVKDSIIAMVCAGDSGASKSQMWEQIDATKEEINEAINELIEKDCIYKTGERRGTRYHLKTPNLSNEEGEKYIAEQQSNGAPLTKAEYNVLWREASESLRAKGIGYSEMMTIVNQVTGHDTAISAFNAKALSKEHIAKIMSLGTQSRT